MIWDGVRLHIAVREVLRGDLIVRPGGHDLPQVFSETLIVPGSALAQVIAIGSVCTFVGPEGLSLSTLGYWLFGLGLRPGQRSDNLRLANVTTP